METKCDGCGEHIEEGRFAAVFFEGGFPFGMYHRRRLDNEGLNLLGVHS